MRGPIRIQCPYGDDADGCNAVLVIADHEDNS